MALGHLLPKEEGREGLGKKGGTGGRGSWCWVEGGWAGQRYVSLCCSSFLIRSALITAVGFQNVVGVNRSTTDIHPIFFSEAPALSPLRYFAEFNGDRHMKTTDAIYTRLVRVRTHHAQQCRAQVTYSPFSSWRAVGTAVGTQIFSPRMWCLYRRTPRVQILGRDLAQYV